jgi:murein DD-endopeptidase MepM/ murein hydrolase activator NlpD
MTNAHRDLATPELWTHSLERSRRRRELLPKARRENNRKKHISAALATAVVAGPGAPLAAAQVSGDLSTDVAAESPANRAIEIREGGLPLRLGSQGELVAHVQTKLGVASDGIFGPQTDAAVRKYQLSAGLDVDGIVGPNTWSSLFAAKATASGANIGGSNVPPEVKEQVEQRLEQAGAQLAAQGQAGADTQVGGQVGTTGPSTTTTQGNTRLPATQVPVSGSCGSSTISAPVHGTVTSPFGPRGGRNHDGIDIAAPTGTPVRAAACGTLSTAGQQSGYGNIVCITHTSQFSTCYAHLSRFGVSNGAQVQQGQVIGYVGCTGNCTGPHLHFETRVNGQAQNPSPYLSGTSIPGKQANVAGASSAGTETSSTGTKQATVAQNESSSTTTTAAAPESVEPTATAQGESELAVPIEATPAEAAPEAVTVQTETTETTEPATVDAQVATPAEAAPEPIAAEPQATAEPVAAEVAPEPVAAEAQVAAPAEAAPAETTAPAEAEVTATAPAAPAAPTVDATADASTTTSTTTSTDAEQAQVDVAAASATQ